MALKLVSIAAKSVLSAVALDILVAILNGDQQTIEKSLKPIGLGATGVVLATEFIEAIAKLKATSQWLLLPTYKGVFIALAVAIIGAILGSLLLTVKVVAAAYPGEDFGGALAFLGLWTMVWGVLGLGFTLTLNAQILRAGMMATPIGTVAMVISAIDTGFGAAETLAVLGSS